MNVIAVLSYISKKPNSAMMRIYYVKKVSEYQQVFEEHTQAFLSLLISR